MFGSIWYLAFVLEDEGAILHLAVSDSAYCPCAYFHREIDEEARLSFLCHSRSGRAGCLVKPRWPLFQLSARAGHGCARLCSGVKGTKKW